MYRQSFGSTGGGGGGYRRGMGRVWRDDEGQQEGGSGH
jgi:hypothetical protein